MRKDLLIILMTFIPPVTGYSQTSVKVMADQPGILEINLLDSLVSHSGNSLVLGENISVTGGKDPYQFYWYRNNEVIGTKPVVEITATVSGGIYRLVVKDANNCSTTAATVGIEDITGKLSDIAVYPVPVSGNLTIDLHDIPGPVNLTIVNNLGSVILRKQISGEMRQEINFPAGIYYLKFEDGKGLLIGHKKIIVP